MFDIRLLNLISFGLLFLAFLIAAGKSDDRQRARDLERYQVETAKQMLERNP